MLALVVGVNVVSVVCHCNLMLTHLQSHSFL